MGFERLTSILQGVDSNYDTDIFMPLFDSIQKATGARPYQGKVGPTEDPEFIDMAYRVVADHIRTLSFAIADGATPSNDGRGYVLRRVLRRAVRFGRQNLGAELGFFAKLVPDLVKLMGDTYPELVAKESRVTEVIREEEESFSRTIDKGLQKFNELSAKVGSDKVFSGEDAHFLYTTMGFPVDLTELMAEEKGLTIDKDGFERKMKEEHDLSAAAHLAKMADSSGKDMRMVAEQTAHLVGKGVSATDDEAKYTMEDLPGCCVKALFIGRNETEDKLGFVESISPESSTVGVVLDKTSFYAESGGQIYDIGTIALASGATIKVDNVQLYGQFVLHVGVVSSGTVNVNDTVCCSVDYERRKPIASNHTMTHVLNHALREVLIHKPKRVFGKESTMAVDQKGSLVDPTKLRFDFSWNSGLSADQLADVEAHCVAQIQKELPVWSYVAPLNDAKAISTLRAVFGEKYPDPVRVVSISDQPVTDMLAKPSDPKWIDYSVEFCGGTHLSNTKEAESFVLLSEEGIAKGVRRIVAVTMDDAQKANQAAAAFGAKLETASKSEGAELETQAKLLKVELNELSISASKKIGFRSQLAEVDKLVLAFNKKKLAGMTDEIVEKAVAAASAAEGPKVVFRFDFGLNGKVAKSVTQAFTKKVQDKALMLVTGDAEADKFMVVAAAPKSMKDFDCKAWVTTVTEGLDAKGGGKKDSAQFQVSSLSNIDSVLSKAVL